jgi:hypothetical protein
VGDVPPTTVYGFYDPICVPLSLTVYIVIPYVMLFFGATGGIIGVASLAGKRWTVVTTISFLIMFVLAFFQRDITGM